MGFFLLGRGRERGDLRLIAEQLFADRQEALDALSTLSAAAEFEHHDADVFVADLDAAVPVLLVTTASPMSSDAATTPVEPEPEPQIAADADEAVEPVATAAAWESPVLDSPPVETSGAVDDAIAEAVVEDAETEDGLAGALRRATTSLESEGISAPESVGPTEADGDSDLGDIPVTTEPEPDTEVVPVPVVESAAEPVAEAGWPWEAAPAPTEDEFVAPKPVIMGSYADEDEPPVAPVVQADAVPDVPRVVDEPVRELLPAPASEPDVVAEPARVADEPSEGSADLEGMLADLEPIEIPSQPDVVESPDPAAVAPGIAVPEVHAEPSDDDGDVTSLTCDDCVYVNTCPNKEDFEPASCGTFQWKSV